MLSSLGSILLHELFECCMIRCGRQWQCVSRNYMTATACSCPLICISSGPYASVELDSPLTFHTNCLAAGLTATSLQVPVDVAVRNSDET